MIVAGGIAAYRCLDLVRRLRERGMGVRCILTPAGAHFVTPMALAALSGGPVYQDLFSLKDESEMGHIRLSREADLVVVAPATADILAKMAAGLADDLATTALLATDKPVLVAPAMNVMMWRHPATRANIATLTARGVTVVGPVSGELACGEVGEGRLAEVPDLVAAIESALVPRARETAPAPTGPLAGRHALVTSGPTHEPIDPVRYISNRSSGKQGHAIAAALRALGARVTLVSGPVTLADPPGVDTVRIETAQEMLTACQAALPADIVVCAAAVADWRVAHPGTQKLKKAPGQPPPPIDLALNPDILAHLSRPGPQRPALVVGFAAETERVVDHAARKRLAKGCDWIVANDVSAATGTFGGDRNTVHFVTDAGIEDWPTLDKDTVAGRLAHRIAEALPDPSRADGP